MESAKQIIEFMKKNDIKEVAFDNGYRFKIEYRLENIVYIMLKEGRIVVDKTLFDEVVEKMMDKYRRSNKSVE